MTDQSHQDANPELIAQEQEAWPEAVMEKHAFL